MTPLEVLAKVRAEKAARRILISAHAQEQMMKRRVQASDVWAVIRTATDASQQDNGSWRLLGGTDVDGQDLCVVISFDGGQTVLVTVFE